MLCHIGAELAKVRERQFMWVGLAWTLLRVIGGQMYGRLVNRSRTRISLRAEVIDTSRPDKQVTKLTSASWIPENPLKRTSLHRVFRISAPSEIFLLPCFYLKHSTCNANSVLRESLRGILHKKIRITRGENFHEHKFPSRRQPHHRPLKINTNKQNKNKWLGTFTYAPC